MRSSRRTHVPCPRSSRSCKRPRSVADDRVTLDVAGREVEISHPDKVYFPQHEETKLDLVDYYRAVEGPLLRAVGGRPTLMQRFPNGVKGNSFFQKRVPENIPDWLETTIVSTPNGTTSRALVLADLAHVLWAVNLGCLGFHTWPYLAADPDHTDELRVDLDPLRRRRLRRPPRGGGRGEGALRRVRHRQLPEDHRIEGHPRLCAPRAPLELLRRSGRGRRPRARARTTPPRSHHRRLVEGGTRAPRLHRLQPERATQDGLRPMVGSLARWRTGLDAFRMGRRLHDPARRDDSGHGPREGGRWPRSVDVDERRAAVDRAAARMVRARPRRRFDGRAMAAGVSQTTERTATRVAPSRAKKES